jgi:hypothetical protein
MIGVFSPGGEKEKDNTAFLNHHLRIYPVNPRAKHEIKIIEKEASSCETLFVKVNDDNRIEYTRRFDSRLLLPCLSFTDTVSIGHLPAGNYTILYKLIDTALPTSDSIIETSGLSFRVH